MCDEQLLDPDQILKLRGDGSDPTVICERVRRPGIVLEIALTGVTDQKGEQFIRAVFDDAKRIDHYVPFVEGSNTRSEVVRNKRRIDLKLVK
jgi:hypothetical protein